VAASEAEVCNLALLLVGQTQFIDDLTDPTEAGEVCKQVYERARDAALEAVAWPFATRRADLNEITDGDRDGWGYAYTLPSDCLAPRWLNTGDENPSAQNKVPFVIEDDATVGKRVLLTNQQDARLVYTRRVTETGKFSPLFVEALAAKIAVYLAAGLVKKPQLALQMMRLFDSVIARAAAAQFNQQQKDEEPDTSFVTERD
jgi:hypothetical protein